MIKILKNIVGILIFQRSIFVVERNCKLMGIIVILINGTCYFS